MLFYCDVYEFFFLFCGCVGCFFVCICGIGIVFVGGVVCYGSV